MSAPQVSTDSQPWMKHRAPVQPSTTLTGILYRISG